jgi:hypothetical protein
MSGNHEQEFLLLDHYMFGTTLEKARNSYQDLIQEHEKKLNDYIANPDAYDNDGRLKNAPNPQIRQQIIQGRINAIQKQIKKQRDELIKIEQELNRRK